MPVLLPWGLSPRFGGGHGPDLSRLPLVLAKHDFAIERKGLKHEVESLLVFTDPGPGNDTMLLVKDIASVAVEEGVAGGKIENIVSGSRL